MINLEKITIEAAFKAGKLLKRWAFEPIEVEWKAENDPVTRLDRDAEEIIKGTINRNLLQEDEPKANFVGEEFGNEKNGSDLTFYIDPLDGTKSFLRKDFRSVVSIGVEEKGKLTGGVVYDFMRGIFYVGFGDKYYVGWGEEHFVKKGIDCCPFPQKRLFGKPRISVDNKSLPKLISLQGKYSIVKPEGSFALSMIEVALGACDALVDYYNDKGQSYDVAGALYILQNFATITDKEGNPFDYKEMKNNGMVAIRHEFDEELRPILECQKPKVSEHAQEPHVC